tara:strand:- start:109 stop:354 length:246 start_codon:yes stop_codon:yes gene_type:complete
MNKDEVTDRLRENRQQDAKMYHNVFVKNPDGSKIFENWIQKYCFSNFTPEDATMSELAKSEARREFVAMIVQKINLAESGD